MPIALALLAVLAAAPVRAADSPAPRSADQAREFLFPADLGPETLDVSGYPAAQRRRYRVVAERCGACHTLARTLNSRLVTKRQWAPYADRMHWLGSGVWDEAARGQAADILKFLAYDSRRRKVKDKARFETQAAALEERFAKLRKERGFPKEAAP